MHVDEFQQWPKKTKKTRLKIIEQNIEAKYLKLVYKSLCRYTWCGVVGNKQDLESEDVVQVQSSNSYKLGNPQ